MPSGVIILNVVSNRVIDREKRAVEDSMSDRHHQTRDSVNSGSFENRYSWQGGFDATYDCIDFSVEATAASMSRQEHLVNKVENENVH